MFSRGNKIIGKNSREGKENRQPAERERQRDCYRERFRGKITQDSVNLTERGTEMIEE